MPPGPFGDGLTWGRKAGSSDSLFTGGQLQIHLWEAVQAGDKKLYPCPHPVMPRSKQARTRALSSPSANVWTETGIGTGLLPTPPKGQRVDGAISSWRRIGMQKRGWPGSSLPLPGGTACNCFCVNCWGRNVCSGPNELWLI